LAAISGNSVLVYDVGGSHVSAALCGENTYELGQIASSRYPAETTSEAFLDFLYELGKEAANGHENVLGAELAFPGPFDYPAGISRMEHKLPCLLGVDLRHSLAGRFGFRPERVRFLNDADSYLLGEVGAGAARGVPRCVGITLGTGIGSAFAVDGHVVTSGDGVPPHGEIWNLPFAGGIVEDQLSTRALQCEYQQRTGKLLEVSEIAAQAPSDPDAAGVFAGFGVQLGIAIRTLMREFAPQVVVLGGGIARSAQLFLPQAQQELEGLGIELRIARLFDHAPLVGAAVAWFDRERNGSR
jgi:glucokinase